MLKIQDVIELKTNDPSKSLVFATRYLVQINYTFDLSLENDLLGGSNHFCVRKDQVKEFVENLTKIQNSVGVKARLDDNDSDGFVEVVASESMEHIKINAQVGGSHEKHVTTALDSDLTALSGLISGFTKLLGYEDSAAHC